MGANTIEKKYSLIDKIMHIQNDKVLDEIDLLLQKIEKNHLLSTLVKPIKPTISIEQLKKEQNYKGFDREKFDKLINELDIQEPIEELLNMLSK